MHTDRDQPLGSQGDVSPNSALGESLGRNLHGLAQEIFPVCLLPQVVGCWLYGALAMWPPGTHPRVLHLLIHPQVPGVVKGLEDRCQVESSTGLAKWALEETIDGVHCPCAEGDTGAQDS